MKQKYVFLSAILVLTTVLGLSMFSNYQVHAVTEKSGSAGVQGKVDAPPPTTAATITTPSNGQVFTSIPARVSGLCPGDVLVKIFKNGVFAGSVQCTNGSYSMQIDLFSGANELVAKISDALEQSGPDSSPVSVTFNDAKYGTVGKRITLTSNFAKRGANPGADLGWPIILSGGVGPYAISVDWGDGKPVDLISREFPGNVDLSHVYASAGVFNIIIKATDKNGDSAFLQLVGIANGAITQTNSTSNVASQLAAPKTVPWYGYVGIILIVALVSFWLGKHYMLQALRRKIDI